MATSARTKPVIVETNTVPADSEQAEDGSTAAEAANSAVENALAQFSQEYRPMIRRGSLLRERTAQQIREVEVLLQEVQGREDMLNRIYEAAKRALADQRADLLEELSLLQHGIVGSQAGQQQE